MVAKVSRELRESQLMIFNYTYEKKTDLTNILVSEFFANHHPGKSCSVHFSCVDKEHGSKWQDSVSIGNPIQMSAV